MEENDFDKNKVDDGYIKAVLNACKEAKNLIEKQSKEIEELTLDLEEMTKSNNHKKENWVHKSILNSYISKDKIKAKIEEIDIEIQQCEYADDDTEEYKKDIEKEKRRLLRDKAVLQSLLEKE